MTKYSQVPWHTAHDDSPVWAQAERGLTHVTIADANGVTVATVRGPRVRNNAKLLAASYDLLEQLATMIGYYRVNCPEAGPTEQEDVAKAVALAESLGVTFEHGHFQLPDNR